MRASVYSGHCTLLPLNSSLGNHLHNTKAPLHCGARLSAPHSQGFSVMQSNTANTRIVCGEIQDSKGIPESTASDSKSVLESTTHTSLESSNSQGEVSCDDFRGCAGTSKGDSKTKGKHIETPTESKHSKICDDKSGLSSEQARSYLSGSNEACECRIADLSRKAEC